MYDQSDLEYAVDLLEGIWFDWQDILEQKGVLTTERVMSDVKSVLADLRSTLDLKGE